MELISKKEVIQTAKDYFRASNLCDEALIENIEKLPTIESRPKGKWAKTITYYPYCSNCEWFPEEDEMTHGLYDFCPNCGADMRGKELYKGDEVRRMVDKEIADMRGED